MGDAYPWLPAVPWLASAAALGGFLAVVTAGFANLCCYGCHKKSSYQRPSSADSDDERGHDEGVDALPLLKDARYDHHQQHRLGWHPHHFNEQHHCLYPQQPQWWLQVGSRMYASNSFHSAPANPLDYLPQPPPPARAYPPGVSL